jgi:DNA-binding transcriptional LysR family regulator
MKHLTLQQIDILAQLTDTRGLRQIARKNNLDPSAVSRLLKDVESSLRLKIAVRSTSGFLLTEEGIKISTVAKEILVSAKKFDDLHPFDPKMANWPVCSLGSRGFITAIFAGLFAKNSIEKIQTRLRFVDASPRDLLRSCLTDIVDAALHLENWNLPKTWETQKVASMTWGLVARKEHPIKEVVSLKDCQKYPFISASYLGQDQIERSPDVFPLTWSQRRVGHESQTAMSTKAILLESEDHIGFLPLITLKHEIESGQIKVISVKNTPISQMSLYLSIQQDRVSQKIRSLIFKTLDEIQAIDTKLAKNLITQVELAPSEKKSEKISL